MTLLKTCSVFLIFSLLLAISGCKDPSSSDTGGDIEISGTWQGINPEDSSLVTFAITNTKMASTEMNVEATIQEYDNSNDFLIAYFDQHPAPEYLNKYIKAKWKNLTSTSVILDSYTPKDNPADAEADMTVLYIMVLTKP